MIDDLESLPPPIAIGFLARFKLIPPTGPRQLSHEMYRNVDRENEIYEFRKGSYRVFCFEANGKVIVCSSVLMKKGQKVDKSAVKQAVRLKREYLLAVSQGNLVTTKGQVQWPRD